MIQDYDKLIPELNKTCKLIIGNDFLLKQCNRYGCGCRVTIYNNTGSNKAINRLDSEDSEVDVHKWFGCYYLYVEVKFIFAPKASRGKRKSKDAISQCSISISVFKSLNEKIVQLFRAEWDDYDDKHDSQSTSPHPQPHWHITSDTFFANTFDEYAKEFGEDGFTSFLNHRKEQIPSLKNFHFAMKEKWEEDMKQSTSIDSSIQVSNWFAGLLASIRTELNYIDKK